MKAGSADVHGTSPQPKKHSFTTTLTHVNKTAKVKDTQTAKDSNSLRRVH